ncbi:MAG TPA: carboxypeptidase-like regulatory domain-containing protein [Mucilaginibacter sp.]|nr:carboxypeptidase-like regulatory domain-containing protein [Mucilaginibacter sp.]
MSRQYFLILLLFILPVKGIAQYTISGQVLNGNDKSPVAHASVFLNNSVVGTTTADNGTFTLSEVRPGQYDLVVSCVGYETLHQAVIVNSSIKLPDLILAPKTLMLDEVRIKPKQDWAKNYETFKRLFFGTTEFARQCKITTKGLPDMLDLDFDKTTDVFTARSDDFMEIENKALGYYIRYYLNSLTYDYKTRLFYVEGTAAFSEMTGSKSQTHRWKKNREKAYEGSSMHFLRAVVSNSLAEEGFRALRLIRKTDTAHKTLNGHFFNTLIEKPLDIADFTRLTDVQGEFALSFSDCLYVEYNKKNAHKASADWSEAAITTLIFNEPYSFFDSNGIIINPASVSFNGNWGQRLMADLLPVDYVPDEKDR